jgi:hypothetical protein
MDRSNDGRPVKLLTLINKYSKEALAISRQALAISER